MLRGARLPWILEDFPDARVFASVDLLLACPPSRYAGIIVVRLPGRFRLPLLERALALVVEASKQTDVRGRLWIAEVDRIREYQERVE